MNLPVYSHTGKIHYPKCHKADVLDPEGDHAMNCGSGKDGNGRIGRHDEIKDSIFASMRTANFHPKLEPVHLLP